ncbi:C40 family peptidase, partial [Kitasatospora purpeofusca]|uniref:C40 family peptidase n=1 Tax=Kitasatospora purpeofusca TaxID=67352 RepID=UPI00364E12E0
GSACVCSSGSPRSPPPNYPPPPPPVQLPRTAAAQYNATSDRPVSRGNLKPGDLVFWADRSGFIYHVGLYAGEGRVLHAPRTGRDVQVQPLDTAMPTADYHGATRA